jgi:hypothetical protein
MLANIGSYLGAHLMAAIFVTAAPGGDGNVDPAVKRITDNALTTTLYVLGALFIAGGAILLFKKGFSIGKPVSWASIAVIGLGIWVIVNPDNAYNTVADMFGRLNTA